MQPIKFFAVVILVIGRLCSARIILKSVKFEGALELDRAVVNLIPSCNEKGGKVAAVGGTRSETLVKALASENIPVVLVNNSSGIRVCMVELVRKNPYRLHVFAMTVTNVRELIDIFNEIHGTIWWNHMAYFLIIYRTSNGCNDSGILLRATWRFDALHSTVLCYERKMGIRIYGYNPYTTEAPEPWSLAWYAGYTHPFVKHNRFSVFVRSYNDGSKICKNLKIDKTKNLNNWPIGLYRPIYSKNVGMMSGSKAINDTYTRKRVKTTYREYHRAWSVMLMLALRTFGSFVNGKMMHQYGLSASSYMTDLIEGAGPLENANRMPSGPTVMPYEFAALTQPAGNMSQLRKLISVVDLYSNIGVCIALVATMLILKVFIGHDMMSSFLNIVRIVCNTGMSNIPVTTSSRLFVTGVLMFTVTMQGIYQGNWASLLTTDIALHNVDTYQDLVDSGYMIYTENDIHKMFTDSKLQERIVQLKGSGGCVRWVRSNSSIACFSTTARSMENAEQYRLHLSKSIITTYVVHNFRRDWPLEEIFKSTIRKLVEADILAAIDSEFHKTTLAEFNVHLKMRNEQSFRIMTLADLTFAFVILGTGLTCAGITFVIEILIERFRTRIRRRRDRITRLDC